MLTRQTAKRELKKKGWTYRTAAPELAVHWGHLAHVLRGARESRSLLGRIAKLGRAAK
jgi:hypothetical protein